jgi:hypothetical protein
MGATEKRTGDGVQARVFLHEKRISIQRYRYLNVKDVKPI